MRCAVCVPARPCLHLYWPFLVVVHPGAYWSRSRFAVVGEPLSGRRPVGERGRRVLCTHVRQRKSTLQRVPSTSSNQPHHATPLSSSDVVYGLLLEPHCLPGWEGLEMAAVELVDLAPGGEVNPLHGMVRVQERQKTFPPLTVRLRQLSVASASHPIPVPVSVSEVCARYLVSG